MPVKRDESGRRSVQVEVEVPGTPEEIWQAIATGPGISSWFVPTEVDERVGGATVSHFAPDGSMDSRSTITAWDPPHRFVAESREAMGPGSPTVADEWIVAARAGGTAVVRVVHSWFASSDDWDGQFEEIENGWPAFFRVLRLYLEHFSGQPGTSFQVMGVAPEPKEEAWAALTGPLGLSGATVGERVTAPAGVPPLTGVVEWGGEPGWPQLLIRVAEPAPGLAHLAPYPMGGQVFLSLRLFLYGDGAVDAVARAEPLWQSWVNERFPMSAAPSEAD